MPVKISHLCFYWFVYIFLTSHICSKYLLLLFDCVPLLMTSVDAETFLFKKCSSTLRVFKRFSYSLLEVNRCYFHINSYKSRGIDFCVYCELSIQDFFPYVLNIFKWSIKICWKNHLSSCLFHVTVVTSQLSAYGKVILFYGLSYCPSWLIDASWINVCLHSCRFTSLDIQ